MRTSEVMVVDSVPRNVPDVGAAKEDLLAAATAICWSATASPNMES